MRPEMSAKFPVPQKVMSTYCVVLPHLILLAEHGPVSSHLFKVLRSIGMHLYAVGGRRNCAIVAEGLLLWSRKMLLSGLTEVRHVKWEEAAARLG